MRTSPVRLGLVDTGLGPAPFGGERIAARRHVGAVGGDALADHGETSLRVACGAAPTAPAVVFAAVAGAGGGIEAGAIVAALAWLIDVGVDVVALPLGRAEVDDDVARAIDRVLARGVPVLAAAGDSHPAPLMFPARHPGVIAVGAVDERGALLPECNRRPRLDRVACGVLAYRDRAGVAQRRRGTSIACVAAAVAADW